MINNKSFEAPKHLSQEDFVILQKPEYHKMMSNLIKYQVCRSMKPSELNELRGVYERLGYKLTNPNCGSCVYNMVERLAKSYFAKLEADTKKEISHHDAKQIFQQKREQQKKRKEKYAKTLEQKDGATGQPSDADSGSVV